MNKAYTVIVSLVIFLCAGSFTLQAKESTRPVDYSSYEKILQKYVNEEGFVNYKELLKHRGYLDKFIYHQIEHKDISRFSDEEKKAFWINAYNALTIKLILDHYPLKFGGIRTINWGRPWDKKIKAAGREITLGEIEHNILRKWDPMDPRIHFAINCASMGCPQLSRKPFYPETLDQQLNEAAKLFINNPQKVYLNREKNILYYSAIFKWFEEDFLTAAPDIVSYLKKYLNEDDKSYLEKSNVGARPASYDWNLNEQ